LGVAEDACNVRKVSMRGEGVARIWRQVDNVGTGEPGDVGIRYKVTFSARLFKAQIKELDGVDPPKFQKLATYYFVTCPYEWDEMTKVDVGGDNLPCFDWEVSNLRF
jgi:hypothetical protein